MLCLGQRGLAFSLSMSAISLSIQPSRHKNGFSWGDRLEYLIIQKKKNCKIKYVILPCIFEYLLTYYSQN